MAYSVAVVFKMNGHGEKLGVLELRTEAVLVSMWRCAVSLLAAKVGRERMFIMKSWKGRIYKKKPESEANREVVHPQVK